MLVILEWFYKALSFGDTKDYPTLDMVVWEHLRFYDHAQDGTNFLGRLSFTWSKVYVDREFETQLSKLTFLQIL